MKEAKAFCARITPGMCFDCNASHVNLAFCTCASLSGSLNLQESNTPKRCACLLSAACIASDVLLFLFEAQPTQPIHLYWQVIDCRLCTCSPSCKMGGSCPGMVSTPCAGPLAQSVVPCWKSRRIGSLSQSSGIC